MRSVGCLVSPAKSGVNAARRRHRSVAAGEHLATHFLEGRRPDGQDGDGRAQSPMWPASCPARCLTVKAFKQYDGPHVLTTVPTDYYTVSTVNYGPIIAVIITMERQLSTYRYDDGTNQGWSNEIYVTFQSSVGPNTVDIMKYLIDTYTDADVGQRQLQLLCREARGLPLELRPAGNEEHHRRFAGHRLPVPLCHLDFRRRVLHEVSAGGAHAAELHVWQASRRPIPRLGQRSELVGRAGRSRCPLDSLRCMRSRLRTTPTAWSRHIRERFRLHGRAGSRGSARRRIGSWT